MRNTRPSLSIVINPTHTARLPHSAAPIAIGNNLFIGAILSAAYIFGGCVASLEINPRQLHIQAFLFDNGGLPCQAGRRICIVISNDEEAPQCIESHVDDEGKVAISISKSANVRIAAFYAESIDSAYIVCSKYSGVFIEDLAPIDAVMIPRLTVYDAVLLARVEGDDWLDLRENWISIKPRSEELPARFSLQEPLPINIYSDPAWSQEFLVSIQRGGILQESSDYLHPGSITKFGGSKGWRVGGYVKYPVSASDASRSDQIYGRMLNALISGPLGNYEVEFTEDVIIGCESTDTRSDLYLSASLPGPGTYHLIINGLCNPVHKRFIAYEAGTQLGEIDLWNGWVPATIMLPNAGESTKMLEVLAHGTTYNWIAVPVIGKRISGLLLPSQWALTARVLMPSGYQYFNLDSQVQSVLMR